MNFLAHCALADTRPGILVGGFLGDFLKGPVPPELPHDVRLGVRLHRRLDAFSAVEPNIKTSVMRLPSAARRLAPVFIDLTTDHFLARSFERWHGEPLTDFTARAYGQLLRHVDLLPADAARFLDFAAEHDLFASYVDFGPLERAFGRICRRFRRPELVEGCMASFKAEYAAFQADFDRYYPVLRAHAVAWLAEQPD
ncbi:MAG TPA: ACP phosphodiesterase [Pseudomonadales bacterium]|nr:ACP phosphodiesterase [Pseudomonadales bacterium]